MTTWLTQHFALEELTATEHRAFDNTPPAEVVANLRRTAARLETVRKVLGDNPVVVTSGYRSRALNRAVGGSRTSAHLTGHAADFHCRRFGPPTAVCRAIVEAGVAFDQLIEEGTWTHISFDPRMRGQVLTRREDGAGYAPGLPQ